MKGVTENVVHEIPEQKLVTYIENFDELLKRETQWIALHLKFENLSYFYSFGVEHILTVTKSSLEI